jgi:diguanylate cyclase (GGDEF)-like protein
VSDFQNEERRVAAFSAGAAYFLYPPYDPGRIKELADAVMVTNMVSRFSNKECKILAIDDSPIVCKTYGQIMSRHGLEYRYVTDPLSAMQTIREYEPDLILMDAYMPDIDGYELTRRITADMEFENIRIIMVTGDTKNKSSVEALDTGVSDFLTKPFDEEVLLARMRTQLVSKKLHDELKNAFREMKKLKEKLELMSVTDGMTGLFNHRYFYDTLAREIEVHKLSGEPLSLLLFDIDHFKKFNDTHGHKAGDEVLVKVAEVIKRVVRENDFPARYGGEEFTVILPGADINIAVEIGERLRAGIEAEKVKYEGLTLSVTVSLGAIEYDGVKDESALVVSADDALYKSKGNGRNCLTVAE